MAQDILTFERGLFPQLDQTIKIPGTYLDALNMMRDESGAMFNELGTSLVHALPANYKIVGLCNLGDDIIIASTNDTLSEIGVLNSSDTYISIINTAVFGFRKSNRVNLEARFNFRGDRLLYIAGEGIKLRALNLDNIPSTDLDKQTNLFLEYTLPKIELNSVFEGGNVRSGVYQFAARLVTESNNKTGFGPISGIIPIGTGSISGNRKDYDGGDPQSLTPNAISLNIENIDTSFEYIEPCVVTYIGEGNAIRVRSLGRIPINNRNTMSLVYSGVNNEQGDVLESELNIDSTSYESGKYLVQKDSTLIISGITEEEDTINWQSIANQIKIRYVEHELTYNEQIDVRNADGNRMEDLSDVGNAGLGPWIDRGTIGTLEDYKNPRNVEKFTSYKRNEVYSFTFTPVFTNGRKGDAFHIPALNPTDSRMLEYVTSTGNTYPSGFGSLTNTPVRYHKMPDHVKSPFFKKVGGVSKIVALGVEFEVPQGSWTNEVSGYIVGRESREGRETIISQGIIKGIYKIGSGTENAYTPIPSFGRMSVEDTDSTNRRTDTNDHKKIFTFHSPDLIIENKDFIPNKLRRINRMNCKVEFANTGERARLNCSNMVLAEPGTFYNDVQDLTGNKTFIPSHSEHPLDEYWAGSNNVNRITPLLGGQVSLHYRRILECTALETVNDYIQPEKKFIDRFSDRGSGGGTRVARYRFLNQTDLFDFDMDLYEVERANTVYYGDIYNKESTSLVTVLFDRNIRDPRTGNNISNFTPIVFKGDTYISRFAHTIKDTIAFRGTIGKYSDIPRTSSVIYFFLESKNNYNYRHYRETDNNITTPYFPKFRTLFNEDNGICDLPVSSDHSRLYNKQYSAENIFQRNYTRGVDEERITRFDNRSIYSATSTEGEKFDAYRLFLPGNYHDIPKQFGKITSSFVLGNDLYFHTERSLWRSFYNTLATQATSEGDIVLGNGGAFPRPSVPILTVDAGYAGCINLEASVGTPLGRFFYDANNAKVYLLSEGLSEISNPSTFNLLRDKAYKKDAVLGYDTGRKRLILSSENLTLSYKPELSSFDGRHSYSFHNFVNRDLKDYLIKNNQIHKYDVNKVGEYFGTKYNSFLKLNSVVHNNISKLYTNAEVVLTSRSLQGLNTPFEFFNWFKMYSHERNTGFNTFNVIQDYTEDLETLGNIFVYKANNKFRFAFPPDVVYDINKDIHDVTNLVTHSSYLPEDKVLLPNMVDNHMVFEFTLDNISKQRIVKINSIIINFEQNIT